MTETVRQVNYDEYPDLNKIPERFDDFPLTDDEIPYFVHLIINSISITPEGKRNFASRYLREYFQSKKFRELTDGWIFVFVNGDYFGGYKNVEEGLSEAWTAGLKKERIDIYRMYNEWIYEYRETLAKSEGVKIKKNVINRNTNLPQTHTSTRHNYLTVDGSIGAEEGENTEIYTEEIKYIIDTGATDTRGCDDEYYNYVTKRYNEYPYDENNNVIRKSQYKNHFYEKLNSLIIYTENVSCRDANDNIYEKSILYLDDKSRFVINKSVFIPLDKITMDYVDIDPTKNVSAFSRLINFGEKVYNFKRPLKSAKLMGLNVIFGAFPEFRKVKNDLNILILSDEDPEKDLIRIYQLKSGIELFTSKTQSRFSDEEIKDNKDKLYGNDLFRVSKECLIYEVGYDYHHDKYVNERPINLAIVKNNLDIDFIKELIENNDNIDGILYREDTFPKMIQIWFKNVKILTFIHTINYNTFDEINEITYYQNYSKKDLDIIFENKLSEYTININQN